VNKQTDYGAQTTLLMRVQVDIIHLFSLVNHEFKKELYLLCVLGLVKVWPPMALWPWMCGRPRLSLSGGFRSSSGVVFPVDFLGSDLFSGSPRICSMFMSVAAILIYGFYR
jgi:hypothetical protein